jgi:hypothetical protein
MGGKTDTQARDRRDAIDLIFSLSSYAMYRMQSMDALRDQSARSLSRRAMLRWKA